MSAGIQGKVFGLTILNMLIISKGVAEIIGL